MFKCEVIGKDEGRGGGGGGGEVGVHHTALPPCQMQPEGGRRRWGEAEDLLETRASIGNGEIAHLDSS